MLLPSRNSTKSHKECFFPHSLCLPLNVLKIFSPDLVDAGTIRLDVMFRCVFNSSDFSSSKQKDDLQRVMCEILASISPKDLRE